MINRICFLLKEILKLDTLKKTSKVHSNSDYTSMCICNHAGEPDDHSNSCMP